MEKISVIIPTYNDEKYLANCIDSVLKQTYSNFEIILVDDGSTDTTPTICEKYHEKYKNIRVLHKKNGGVGSSRNAGLAMATGEYIVFVDGDDWLDNNHVEALYNLLKKNNASIAVGNFTYFLENKRLFSFFLQEKDYFEKTYSPKEWFEIEYNSKYMMDLIFTVPWGKIYKRSLFENIVYPINLDFGEDDLTTWKIYLLADKIAYMNKPIYFYRKHDDSIMSKHDSRTSPFSLKAVEERIGLLSQIGFDVSQEIGAYRYRLNLCFEDALKDGDYTKYQNAKQKLAILEKYNSK